MTEEKEHPNRRDIDIFFLEIEDRLEKILDKKLAPLTCRVEKHNNALYGKDDGRTGIVKDINDMCTTVAVFKWLISIFGIFTITNIIAYIKGIEK